MPNRQIQISCVRTKLSDKQRTKLVQIKKKSTKNFICPRQWKVLKMSTLWSVLKSFCRAFEVTDDTFYWLKSWGLTGSPWAGGCWVGDTFLWTKCCLIMDNSGDVECAGGWGWQSNNITIFHPQFPHPSTLSLRVPIRLSVPGVSGPVFMDWSKYPIYYDNPPPSPAHTVASSPGLADTQMEGFIS